MVHRSEACFLAAVGNSLNKDHIVNSVELITFKSQFSTFRIHFKRKEVFHSWIC